MRETDKKEAVRRHKLVKGGDLKSALAALDEAIQREPNDDLLHRERGHLLLALGEAPLARAAFETTARLDEWPDTKFGHLHSDIELNAIGLAYWMEGHRELAGAFWRYTTRSLYLGRVSYSHAGGGAEAGLLLWFGAIHERTSDDIELVREFYTKRLEGKHWSANLKRGWPGPIVRFFLDQIDEKELLETAESSDPELGRDANVCNAHFALATRAREHRRHAAYKKHLKLAAGSKSQTDFYEFYNVWTYFLARFEVEVSGWWRNEP